MKYFTPMYILPRSKPPLNGFLREIWEALPVVPVAQAVLP